MRTVSFFAGCLLLGAALVSGCASAGRPFLYQINDLGKLNKKSLNILLFENAIRDGENISNTLILRTEHASYHLVQVRGGEEPHRHQFHDLAVFLQSGYGKMNLGKQSFGVKPGAVIFVPRDTPHSFVNLSPAPAVAIVVFSPPYDGQDNVPVPPAPTEPERR